MTYGKSLTSLTALVAAFGIIFSSQIVLLFFCVSSPPSRRKHEICCFFFFESDLLKMISTFNPFSWLVTSFYPSLCDCVLFMHSFIYSSTNRHTAASVFYVLHCSLDGSYGGSNFSFLKILQANFHTIVLFTFPLTVCKGSPLPPHILTSTCCCLFSWWQLFLTRMW